ncbi:MAG: carboxypeptidase-like regulatory domain-containing protein [Nocardioidaceae bacterium]
MLASVAVATLLSGCNAGSSDGSHGETTRPTPRPGYVAGLVFAAPACPVESDTGECPIRPISRASVEIRVDGTRVASGLTDTRGRFRLESPPGDAVIVVQSIGGLGSQTQRDIHVTSGQTTMVRLGLDIGIRMQVTAP